jgi:hypothetical protein
MMLVELWGKPMAARMLLAAMVAGVALAGCDPLPKPLYTEYTPPAAFRTEADGVRVDNEGYQLDSQGYRVNKRGERIGMVDVQAKTAGDKSNAVAGYWISNIGEKAPGSVATPSGGAGSGSGPGSIMNNTLPTPATMPQQAPITPTPGNVAPPPGYR